MEYKAVNRLFNSIKFNEYDKNYIDYIDTLNELLVKYDYQSVIDRLIELIKLSNSVEIRNKKSYFKTFMSSGLKKRLTNDEYFKKDKEFVDKFTNDFNEIKKTTNSKSEKSKINVNRGYYEKYTHNYLMEVSKRLNRPIVVLCEEIGLIPSWLIFVE